MWAGYVSVIRCIPAKDCLLTSQEQACNRITRLFGSSFVWLVFTMPKKGLIHGKMVFDCLKVITFRGDTLFQTRPHFFLLLRKDIFVFQIFSSCSFSVFLLRCRKKYTFLFQIFSSFSLFFLSLGYRMRTSHISCNSVILSHINNQLADLSSPVWSSFVKNGQTIGKGNFRD